MTSKSIYIGLVLSAPIYNQKRYEAVFNEILQYLVVNNRFLTFQSSNGNISDQITLPLSSLYLHTCYFKIHSGFELSSEDKKFAAITWEVLNILKENFPSKIYLSQENLDQCKPQYIPMTISEENRRQISCLMSIKEEDRYLTLDEFEDAWFTLQSAEKLNNQRALNTCLELISQQTQNWAQVKSIVEIEALHRIINKNDYTQLTSNKLLAQDILDKLNSSHLKQGDLAETFQRQLNEFQCEETISLVRSDCGTATDYTATNHQTLKKLF